MGKNPKVRVICAQSPAEVLEHERLFIEGMTAMLDKHAANGATNSKLLTSQKHADITELLDNWADLSAKERKQAANGSGYHWVKKYEIVPVAHRSGTFPMTEMQLVFAGEGPLTAATELQVVSHQGRVFADLKMVHVDGAHCKARAFHDRTKAKFGKSIPQWAVLLFAELCPTCVRRLARKTTSAGHKPILTRGLGSRGQVDLIDFQSCPDRHHKFLLNYQDQGVKLYDNAALESKRACAVAYALLEIFTRIGAPAILQSDNGREFSGQAGGAAGRARGKEVLLSDEVRPQFPNWSRFRDQFMNWS